jgi:hypothetical protein
VLKEHRLKVFENMLLRRIFGLERGEVTGSCRKLHDEELQNLYSSPNIIRMIISRRMRWAGHVAHFGEIVNAYKILVSKPEGKRALGRPRHRWEANIKTDHMEIGIWGMDWTDLFQDRWRALVNTVMDLCVP